MQLALEFAGRARIGPLMEIAVLATAVLFLGAYFFYARRTHDPVVDLELFRIKSFRIGNGASTLSLPSATPRRRSSHYLCCCGWHSGSRPSIPASSPR